MAISFVAARESMVKEQLVARGITDKRVLDAMQQVPREQFVNQDLRSQAYFDGPLPIGSGQTISQPYIVALMLQALVLQPDDTVLDIGTGSGYAAAVLSLLCKKVYSVERVPLLARRATEVLEKLNYFNIEVLTGDGSLGWLSCSPYEGIVVAAGGPHVPESLKGQLAIGGRLVMPVGKTGNHQVMTVVQRTSAADFQESSLGDVRFVPLIGAEGFSRLGGEHSHNPRSI